jgi:uncharacterized protein (TIGR02145 family)
MKRIYLSIILICIALSTYSQATYYPLVKTSGAGETSISNFNYSHHTNYTMRITKLTAKWKLTTLFGEPVIDGIFKWVAGSNTPANYLDYRDCILLECSPVKSTGYSVYIKLTPTVPKSGEAYGYNTPGSPSWANVFCTRKGQDMTREIPGFTANTAKAIWKNGFRVTGIVLTRIGGSDGYLQAGKNNNSDNTATQNDPKQKEAIEQQKQLSQQDKDKYNALKSPYTLNVNNRDTVSEASLQALKAINPYFQNGMLIVSSVNNGKVISKTNTVNANVQLAEGWNMLRIAIKGDNYYLNDSVRVYYKKDGRFGKMTDQQGNVYKTVKIGNQVWMAENLRFKAPLGCWAYNNDESNVKIYGYLYNWKTAMNVCPQGWHLPSKAEWEVLAKALGGEDIAGAVMKNTNDEYKDLSGTNNRGINALLGGYRNSSGFYHLTSEGGWWCSTKSSTSSVYKISLYNSLYKNLQTKVNFYTTSDLNETGLSVRCIKD